MGELIGWGEGCGRGGIPAGVADGDLARGVWGGGRRGGHVRRGLREGFSGRGRAAGGEGLFVCLFVCGWVGVMMHGWMVVWGW